MPRVDVTGQIKNLEQEGQAIEAELLELFSDPELRLAFVPLVDGCFGHGHEPCGIMPLTTVLPSRISSNGMGGHNPS
jgi:hypothetical protein